MSGEVFMSIDTVQHESSTILFSAAPNILWPLGSGSLTKSHKPKHHDKPIVS
jgi:hypothetical protein